MKNTQRGVGAVAVIATLIVFCMVFASGWYLYNKKSSPAKNEGVSSASSAEKPEPVNEQIARKNYMNSSYGLSLSYPENWVLKESLKDANSNIQISSPQGTQLSFALSKSGRGGACLDSKGEATAEYCWELDYLESEKIPTKSGFSELYLYKRRVVKPTTQGGEISYEVGLSSSEPKLGSNLVAYGSILLSNSKGNIIVTYTGKDDASRSSDSFFKTSEVAEIESVLRTVNLEK